LSSLYPINLKLEGFPCLVVGGGKVALRKARSLLECGADLTIVSPELHPDLRALCTRFRWLERPFSPADVSGARLVVCATNDSEVNLRVCAQAREQGALVNVADHPEECDFTVPSVLRRGRLQITVSTDGASPGYSRRLRQELEERYPPDIASYIDLLAEARQTVRTHYPDAVEQRESLMRAVLNLDVQMPIDADVFRERVQKLCLNPPA
jgi:precorrin-2 dehydrogenase/sirohydrochlorin ferrochelatase